MTIRHCFVATALLAVSLRGQRDTGTLTGAVVDKQHHFVAGAKVAVLKEGNPVATGATDSNGTFRFTLPAGGYTIQTVNGTEPKAVIVIGKKTVSIELALQANNDQPQFFDEPQFTVAGVTDNTYRGGHGSDNVLRSSETLTKATASLSKPIDVPDAGENHHARAVWEERSGQPLEAVKEFQKAAESSPSERNIFDWGTELLAHKAPQAAAEVFIKGSERYPHSVRMILGEATSWYAAGSYDKAAHCFLESIALNPNDPVPYSFLIKARTSEVIQNAGYYEAFARFANLQPDNPQANYYYGVSIWEQRNGPDDKDAFDLAVRSLEKALTLNPHLAEAYLELGIVHASQREYPQAITAYRKAIAEEAELEEAHYRLSEAYRLSGDRAEARAELATFHRLSKQSTEQVEKERRDIRQFVIALKNTNQ